MVGDHGEAAQAQEEVLQEQAALQALPRPPEIAREAGKGIA
jgi:hypothetical protein